MKKKNEYIYNSVIVCVVKDVPNIFITLKKNDLFGVVLE